ncbi:hypothetical protein O7602_18515 [Micromonospora sp. WMMD1128]|uniref:hypothetical protein n=1 Tax=Micromonospora sp. WMMD1128 TaxID=3015150 RepID=UPI00248C5C0A|nr:hypothetical protein [Micromonospora sp. WMMD1128]WBB71730.1 hypothetical protein O7602_18515 [Micromonospora sp. WMMD1128]
MLGTFGAFWLGPMAHLVENPGKLCAFVFSATGAFAVGYLACTRRAAAEGMPAPDSPRMRTVHRLVILGAIHYGALGVAYLREYGATGPGSILASLQEPATAYANKFQIYDVQQTTGGANPAVQVLTLLAVFSTALVPLLVLYWRELSVAARTAGITGIALYSVFFLYIGTLKGLGDFAIMAAAGLLLASGRRRAGHATGSRLTRKRILTIVLFGLFCWYLINTQADRTDLFGTTDKARPNATVEQVLGPHLATGVTAMVLYPTHGYLGLAYNLDTPFEWSRGLGSTVAISSYAAQYLNVDPGEHPSYLERTEARTGWPADLYWATVYPWLASDLSFPGTVGLMALVGWVFARTWREATVQKRVLPGVIFTQLCILIAYIPANNALGTRPALIGLATLFACYLGTGVVRWHRRLQQAYAPVRPALPRPLIRGGDAHR